MKQTIKLKESELKQMIAESVRRILKESGEYYTVRPNSFAKDDRLAAKGYVKNSANMPNPDYDDVSPYSDYRGDYYAAGERDSEKMFNDNEKLSKKEKISQKAADRRWQKAADSRPLHRKGSLNRAFNESCVRSIVKESIRKVLKEEVDTGQVPSASEKRSTSPSAPDIRKKIRALRNKIDDYEKEGKDISELQKQIVKLKKEAGFCESANRMQTIISESIKKVLNEKWYPEEEDDISDYSFGMIAKLSTRSLMQLDEEAIARLENIHDENVEYEDTYLSVMVRNVSVSCDEDRECSVTIECAVSAPDMPTHEIEQEVEEILWLWIENITGQRLVSGFDWESEDTVFDRRSKNK